MWTVSARGGAVTGRFYRPLNVLSFIFMGIIIGIGGVWITWFPCVCVCADYYDAYFLHGKDEVVVGIVGYEGWSVRLWVDGGKI